MNTSECIHNQGGIVFGGMGIMCVGLALTYLAGTCAGLAQGYNPHTMRRN